MEKLKLYSVTDLQSCPVELLGREELSNYYCRIPVPLPEQIVLFAVGQWPTGKKDVTLDVCVIAGDEEVLPVGSLDINCRCLLWEKSSSDTVKNINTQGVALAKLLVEVRGLDVTTQSQTKELTKDSLALSSKKKEQANIQAEMENTPQVVSTPSPLPRKPGKQKKRGRDSGEGTPDGPTPRKQRQNTRMRALKNEFRTPNKKAKKDNKDLKVLGQNNSVDVQKSGSRLAYCKDVSGRGPNPSSRWGSSLCMVHNNRAVLIGGQGERQQLSRDSVWSLDPDTRHWRCPDVAIEGQKTEYRMGHTAAYDPMVRCIYVYGGSKNLKWFNDVHLLDVDEWKWQLVKVNGKAPTRAYHSATLYRHELWIFGGVYPRSDPKPDGCSNDIHIFSPVMENWYCPIVTGEKPLPRSGHSATLIKDQLVVFGGWDAPIPFNDLYVLDMSTVDWSKPEVNGTPPIPRSWHASCALSNDRILIHGGYDGNNTLDDAHIFNLGTLTWMQIKIENAPAARAGNLSLCLPYNHENQEEDEVLIFGGGDNDGAFFNDLFSICIPFNPVLEEPKKLKSVKA